MILPFRHLARHAPLEDIILQNFEQAEEHRQLAMKLSPLTEDGLRWRKEAMERWLLAHEERKDVRLRAILGAA